MVGWSYLLKGCLISAVNSEVLSAAVVIYVLKGRLQPWRRLYCFESDSVRATVLEYVSANVCTDVTALGVCLQSMPLSD